MLTNAETLLAAAIKAGSVREIPGLVLRMSEHQKAVDEIDRRPWIEKEKHRVIRELEVSLRGDVETLVEQARTRELKEFDRREGALRAEARADGANATDAQIRSQVFRNQRAQQLASLADRAASPAAARAVFDQAMLSDDADTIRLVGASVKARLDSLAAVEKGKAMSPLRDQALLFAMEHDTWRKSHPSPVEELREIERARGNARIQFDQSAQFALSLYEIGKLATAPVLRPVPDVEPSHSGIRIGPAFEKVAVK